MNDQTIFPSTLPLQGGSPSRATGKGRNQLKSFSLVWQRMGSIPRWLPIVLLATVVLAGLFFGTTHTSFAKATFSLETCANAPAQDKIKFCSGTDPMQQGCTADAKTLFTTAVKTRDQKLVGWAQERHSQACGTYWVRGYTSIPNTQVSVYMPDLGKDANASYVSNAQSAYSNMVYTPIDPAMVVQVNGPHIFGIATIDASEYAA